MSGSLLFGWLKVSKSVDEAAFRRVNVVDAAAFDATISKAIAGALVDARIEPALGDILKKRLTKAKYAEVCANNVDPKRDKGRKGDFGEILAAHLMEQCLGYVVPVRKLRYAKVNHDDIPHGIDVMALKVVQSGELVEVCFIESKLRTVTDKTFAVQAHDQLSLSWHTSVAEYHLFFVTILALRDQALLSKFLDYMDGKNACETTFCLALHSDSGNWHDEALKKLKERPPTLSPLLVILCLLKELGKRVTDCFDQVGWEMDEGDD